jgi:hypothetical protein
MKTVSIRISEPTYLLLLAKAVAEGRSVRWLVDRAVARWLGKNDLAALKKQFENGADPNA